jgi:hypothetical protein
MLRRQQRLADGGLEERLEEERRLLLELDDQLPGNAGLWCS